MQTGCWPGAGRVAPRLRRETVTEGSCCCCQEAGGGSERAPKSAEYTTPSTGPGGFTSEPVPAFCPWEPPHDLGSPGHLLRGAPLCPSTPSQLWKHFYFLALDLHPAGPADVHHGPSAAGAIKTLSCALPGLWPSGGSPGSWPGVKAVLSCRPGLYPPASSLGSRTHNPQQRPTAPRTHPQPTSTAPLVTLHLCSNSALCLEHSYSHCPQSG